MPELSFSDWISVLGLLGTVFGIFLTLYLNKSGPSASLPLGREGDVGHYDDFQLAEPRTFTGWCDRYIWWRHRPMYVHAVSTVVVFSFAAAETIYLLMVEIDDGPFRAITALLHQVSYLLLFPFWGLCIFQGLRLLRQLWRA